MNRRAAWRDALFLLVVVVVLWGVVYKRWSPRCWGVPISYETDGLYEFAAIKAAADGRWFPFLWTRIPELNAPTGANWNDLPITENLLYSALGLVARTCGLMATANVASLVAHILSALAFYWTCRQLRCDRVWALAGAVIFSFSNYAIFRGFAHLELSYYWHIPLGILVTWWLGRNRLSTRQWTVALCVGAVTGLQSPYYTNVFVQLCGLAMIVHLLRHQPRPTVKACVAVIAVTLGAVLLGNLDTVTYQMVHGPNPDALERTYSDMEVYALKPIELFLPGTWHRWPWMTLFTRTYADLALVRGEFFSPYLGIVGIVGFVWLCIAALRRRRMLVEFGQIFWILFYSVVGGLNAIVGLLGVPLFRATNRYSIFILCIALLFLMRRLTAHTRSWRPAWRVACAVSLCTLALMDQVYRHEPNTGCEKRRAIIRSDREFAEKMEGMVPRGAMVFQLPVMLFPESAAIGGMRDYDHFRPYLFTRTLRYTYGDDRGRHTEDWQYAIEKLAPAQAAEAMKDKGFSAVMLNTRAYTEHPDVLEAWRAVPHRAQVESAIGDLLCLVF